MTDTTNIADILRQAISETDSIEDSIGRTQLIQMADKISLLPKDDTLRKQAEEIVTDTVQNVNSLTVDTVRNLLFFIDRAMLNKSEIIKISENIVKHHQLKFNDPRSKGEVIRFLLENGIFLPARIIVNSQDIYESDRWTWIDLMALTNWHLAKNKILESVNDEGTVKNLISRLPYYWKKFGQEKLNSLFISLMKVKLNTKDQASLNVMIKHLTGDSSLVYERNSDGNSEELIDFLTNRVNWNDDITNISTQVH
ncbi:MAG: hypothetical protein JAY90_20640 [Candidatus Thiodiazotropha lotti]|nr:hypothetical protein [Candidatus Thiodiazotropha lotti]